MLFAVVCDHLSLAVDYSCGVVKSEFVGPLLHCFDVAKGDIDFESQGKGTRKLEVNALVLLH